MNLKVQDVLALFDEVFAKLGQRMLLDNSEFTIDNQLPADFYLKFNSVAKPGRVNMNFEVTSSNVTFWIDKTREMPDFSYEMIREDPARFKDAIEMIFSSTIHAEYKGNRAILSFINNDNILVGKYRFHLGILPNWCSRKFTKIYDSYFEFC
ncbi:hypothetical protein [Hymenobacter sp. GOD-10R]|uniref:hypothetical protein n=1 Tax=Hymenobacter sp. GOD-10R TaxID=3093922 RepID=UPI002D79D4E5|nr:hypothetical protein [Hymenobacter sp. GOD-10R]WRQ30957.1 hypothetical protein SD425_11870 [Hymenobacter sp. GOD-10R]